MIALTGREMKELDRMAIESKMISGIELMGHAGMAVFEEILKISEAPKCLILCGPGNNGGDGFAVAALLMAQGHHVDVLFLEDSNQCSEDARHFYQQMIQYDALLNLQTKSEMLESMIEHADLIVDAIFGFSCSRPIIGPYADVIMKVNQAEKPVIAVDIPSGIHADHGQVMGIAIKATKTITFTVPKVGLFLYPGALYTGQIIAKDIGISEELIQLVENEYHLIDDGFINLMPKRHVISHKGTYGKVVMIAGSKDMCGAAILAAKAAYRTGSGLVQVVTESGNETALFASVPEAVVMTYTKDIGFQSQLQAIKEKLNEADAILVGPGLSKDSYAKALVEAVLSLNKKKIVIDADGLNLVAEQLTLLENHQNHIVVTPHIGEMARLTGYSSNEILDHTVEFAKAFSKRYQLITVLKSARTVIAVHDKTFINVFGHSGMATAGSGDVLAGVIVSLMGQGCSEALSGVLGSYLHAKAGHVILERTNPYSMMATDIIEGLNEVLA